MTSPDLLAQAQAVAQALNLSRGTSDLPFQVLQRLGALTGRQPIAYADWTAEATDDGRNKSGTVILLTEKQVIRAKLTGTPTAQTPDQGPPGTVDVKVWARADLVGNTLPEGVWGADWSWSETWTGWPRHAPIELDYGVRGTLQLPLHLETTNESLLGLLPSLMADLAAR